MHQAPPEPETPASPSATFALVHAAGDGAWSWHRLEAELRRRGHDVVAPDLPADDDSAGLWDYADVVVNAIGDRTDVAVVGHSFGAFTAPLVCTRVEVKLLVLLAPMIPAPDEPPDDWWTNTNYAAAKEGAEELDDIGTYYHDVPRELAAEALRSARNHPSSRAGREPWPLDRWPETPTRVLLARDDRLFPAEFQRRLAHERLGINADEIPGGHTVPLSHPRELADWLERYWLEH